MTSESIENIRSSHIAEEALAYRDGKLNSTRLLCSITLALYEIALQLAKLNEKRD